MKFDDVQRVAHYFVKPYVIDGKKVVSHKIAFYNPEFNSTSDYLRWFSVDKVVVDELDLDVKGDEFVNREFKVTWDMQGERVRVIGLSEV